MPRPSRLCAVHLASWNEPGPDRPDVAPALGNLATLLQDTNRLAEAEPLMRRALAMRSFRA